VVNRLLETISFEEDFETVISKMLCIVGENTGADHCRVCRYLDDQFNNWREVASWITPEAQSDKTRCIRADIASLAGRHGQFLERRFVISKEEPAPGQPPVRQQMAAGLWANNQLYGFVVVDHRRNGKGFTDQAIHALNCFVSLFRLAHEGTSRQEELQESISLPKQIMDNIAMPLLLVDVNYHIHAANPRKKIGANMSREDVLGSRCYHTICEFDSPPHFCPVRETLKTQKPTSKEFDFGDKQIIMAAQPIFGKDGALQYVLCIDIDMTEANRQKKELKIAMEQAQAANLAKSAFLATVSHELRTPLNAVIGFTELLLKGNVDETAREEYLRSINFAGTSLLNLINDVLDLSSLEGERTEIAPSRSDLADLIGRIVAVFKLKASEKDLELSADTAEIRYPLYVDNLRLRQILLNLIGNAIKFTPAGRVNLKASFVPEDNETGTLTITVSDTGIGIAPENQEKIFEPFVHDSVLRGKWVYEGTGLGLTITRRLLDKMGGTIQLESRPDVGSTFTVRLDKVKYEASGATPPEPQHPLLRPTRKSERKPRMLLVDDIPLNLKVLEAMLKLLNVESTLAESADAALEILHQDRNYDMILTDMWMPEASGAELAERLRNEGGATNIPIAAVTADTQIAEKDRNLFAYILYKPITLESLEHMLGWFETTHPQP
jgi:signal transduction histidine kinase